MFVLTTQNPVGQYARLTVPLSSCCVDAVLAAFNAANTLRSGSSDADLRGGGLRISRTPCVFTDAILGSGLLRGSTFRCGACTYLMRTVLRRDVSAKPSADSTGAEVSETLDGLRPVGNNGELGCDDFFCGRQCCSYPFAKSIQPARQPIALLATVTRHGVMTKTTSICTYGGVAEEVLKGGCRRRAEDIAREVTSPLVVRRPGFRRHVLFAHYTPSAAILIIPSRPWFVINAVGALHMGHSSITAPPLLAPKTSNQKMTPVSAVVIAAQNHQTIIIYLARQDSLEPE